MRDGINILVEHVSTLRKKESLYRNAFTRRCQDLWKAETEVMRCNNNFLALICL